MEPLEYRDRESRFQDACEFAAAVVLFGLIVVAGEASMHRAGMQEHAEVKASNVAPGDYLPHELTLDAVESGPHIEVYEE